MGEAWKGIAHVDLVAMDPDNIVKGETTIMKFSFAIEAPGDSAKKLCENIMEAYASSGALNELAIEFANIFTKEMSADNLRYLNFKFYTEVNKVEGE